MPLNNSDGEFFITSICVFAPWKKYENISSSDRFHLKPTEENKHGFFNKSKITSQSIGLVIIQGYEAFTSVLLRENLGKWLGWQTTSPQTVCLALDPEQKVTKKSETELREEIDQRRHTRIHGESAIYFFHPRVLSLRLKQTKLREGISQLQKNPSTAPLFGNLHGQPPHSASLVWGPVFWIGMGFIFTLQKKTEGSNFHPNHPEQKGRA